MTTPGSRNIVSCPLVPVSPGRELASVPGCSATMEQYIYWSVPGSGVGHGEREEGGGDLEDINTDRDPPGLNDQIKYN